MQTGIHIGTIVGKESLEPLTDAILRIMDARADQSTICRALDLLERAAESHVSNVSMSGCNITGDPQHTHYHNRAETDIDYEFDD